MNQINLGALTQKELPYLRQDANSKREQKTNLYIYNPSLRNPERFKNFFHFIDNVILIYGLNNVISEEDLIEHLKESSKNENLFNLKQKDITLNTFTKRALEISGLDLVKFKHITKNRKTGISFLGSKYSHKMFGDLNNPENESNLFLFILKMRDSLNLITDLILKTNLKSGNNEGIYNDELSLIYSLYPLLSINEKLDSNFISDFILKIRREFEEFIGYQKKNNNIEYSEFIENKYHNIYNDNPNITFNKWNTISDYIDVLFRVLGLTNCFEQSNYGRLKSINFNYSNIEKLGFFNYYSIEEITEFLNNDKFIEKFELYLKNEFITIQNAEPIEFSILPTLSSSGSFLANYVSHYKKEKRTISPKEKVKNEKNNRFMKEDNYSNQSISFEINSQLFGNQDGKNYQKLKESIISNSKLKYKKTPLIYFIIVERVNRKTLLDFRKLNHEELKLSDVLYVPIKKELFENLFNSGICDDLSIFFQMSKDFFLTIKKHSDINEIFNFRNNRVF